MKHFCYNVDEYIFENDIETFMKQLYDEKYKILNDKKTKMKDDENNDDENDNFEFV